MTNERFRDKAWGRTIVDRRRLLGALGAAGSAVATNTIPAFAASAPRNVTDAPADSRVLQSQPFYGPHQPGVVTPRPAAGMIASFDVLATNRTDLVRLFRRLTERIAFLMKGGSPPELDAKLPPADSGILGPIVVPDNLTITVSVGESLFDNRFDLTAFKPVHLSRMSKFANDALEASLCHGDLSLQFSSNTPDTNIHALRDIVKNLPDLLLLRWKQEGSVPAMPPKAGGQPESARNFLGFRDGSANPEAGNAALMDRLVWVSDLREPAWARGGTYQVVRIIRNFVERWDRTPLQEQEAIIGRRKASGAPLAGGVEHDEPDYGGDPDGKITPLDAHIRLANPRTSEAREHRILRRPFNYSNGVTKSGQLDMGLLFIAYQADLTNGFIAIQNRLKGEPLEEYIKPVGGGYFFTLPGVTGEGDFLGRALFAAAGMAVSGQ